MKLDKIGRKENIRKNETEKDYNEYEEMMDEYLEEEFRNEKRRPRRKDGWG